MIERLKQAYLRLMRHADAVLTVLAHPELGKFAVDYARAVPFLGKPLTPQELRIAIATFCVYGIGGRIVMSNKDEQREPCVPAGTIS